MSDPTIHSPTQARIAVPFLVFSALLLALLIPSVIFRKPVMSPEIRQGWVMHQQATRNFILGQKFVVARLQSPVTFWSPDTQRGEVGRGVWFAQGGVKTARNSPDEPPVFWQVLFIPGDAQPLYLRIGSHEEGDFTAALARAGRQPGKP
jgi:hypothetical protein